MEGVGVVVGDVVVVGPAGDTAEDAVGVDVVGDAVAARRESRPRVEGCGPGSVMTMGFLSSV